jgi:alkyl hydroperoxide reductase subunit AhpF
VEGFYIGGEWHPQCGPVDIEDLNNNQNISSSSLKQKHESACNDDGSYDVLIVGAGCIGTSIARELRLGFRALLLLC